MITFEPADLPLMPKAIRDAKKYAQANNLVGVVRWHCLYCGSSFPTDVSVQRHTLDKHGKHVHLRMDNA